MRVALIASPFISVPPTGYGGTELFIANLAEALARLNVKVDVYANGESRVKAVLHAASCAAGLAPLVGKFWVHERHRSHCLGRG
jgi:hypothetical protein